MNRSDPQTIKKEFSSSEVSHILRVFGVSDEYQRDGGHDESRANADRDPWVLRLWISIGYRI
jgi:hypothetical protein